MVVSLFFLTGLCNLPAHSETPGHYSVLDFGAVGDGMTDDTKAFQIALDKAREEGGGIVYAPRGNYLIAGNLSIGDHVTLEGIWQQPTAWSQNRGTTLLATAGKGIADGTAFITTSGQNPTIKGITIYYPEQSAENDVPTPYPWAIQHTSGDNVSIIDCLLVNPYQAIDLTWAGRHYVRNVYGYPLYRGIFVDKILDVGRIENVHFWPFWGGWNHEHPRSQWIMQNAIAFEFGRSDWQYVTNTFCFGYKTGYRFFQSETDPHPGTTNGNFLGIGADWCIEGLRVDDCQAIGLLITNGEFVASQVGRPSAVVIAPTNRGVIQFSNCSFWGPMFHGAFIEGNGFVSFTGCNFASWDYRNLGFPAIAHLGGRLAVTGCNFLEGKRAIEIMPEATVATLIGNHFRGGLNIENGIGEKAKIEGNVSY